MNDLDEQKLKSKGDWRTMTNEIHHISLCITGEQATIDKIANEIQGVSFLNLDLQKNVISLQYKGQSVLFSEKIVEILSYLEITRDKFLLYRELGLSIRLYCSIFMTEAKQFGFDFTSNQLRFLSDLGCSISMDFW